MSPSGTVLCRWGGDRRRRRSPLAHRVVLAGGRRPTRGRSRSGSRHLRRLGSRQDRRGRARDSDIRHTGQTNLQAMTGNEACMAARLTSPRTKLRPHWATPSNRPPRRARASPSARGDHWLRGNLGGRGRLIDRRADCIPRRRGGGDRGHAFGAGPLSRETLRAGHAAGLLLSWLRAKRVSLDDSGVAPGGSGPPLGPSSWPRSERTSVIAPQSLAQVTSLLLPEPSYQRGSGRGVRCVQLSALRGRAGRKERGDEHILETPPAGAGRSQVQILSPRLPITGHAGPSAPGATSRTKTSAARAGASQGGGAAARVGSAQCALDPTGRDG